MKKAYALLLLAVLSIVLLTSFVLAANTITVQAPRSNVTVGGASVLLNSTFDTQSANVSNVSFYYRASSTSTWTLIADIYQSAGGNNASITFNTTWDTSGLLDSRSYVINATGRNSTGTVSSAANHSIRTDNGVPTASFSSDSPYNFQAFNNGQSFTVGLAADATRGISNCTATLAGNTIELNATSNSCSRSVTNTDFSISSEDENTLYLTAYDDNGNQTNSSTRTVTIYFKSGGGLGGGGGSTPAANTITDVVSDDNVGEIVSDLAKDGSKKGFATHVRAAVSNFVDKIRSFFTNIFNR